MCSLCSVITFAFLIRHTVEHQDTSQELRELESDNGVDWRKCGIINIYHILDSTSFSTFVLSSAGRSGKNPMPVSCSTLEEMVTQTLVASCTPSLLSADTDRRDIRLTASLLLAVSICVMHANGCMNTNSGGMKSLKQMRLEAQQAGVTTTAKLAQTLGVDRGTISKWETDEDSIPLGYYKKWQVACGAQPVPPALSVTRIVRIRKTAAD